MSRDLNRKRGRPPKFGRKAQLISVTLPRDVVDWLETIDDDLGWALVKLHERATKTRSAPTAVAQLVRFPGDRALIIVRSDLIHEFPGVSLIPLSDGRAFLALETGKGVADLELSVLDRLEDQRIDAIERGALMELRQLLRQWRREGIRFASQSVIVAHGKRGAMRQAEA
jgi:hypothetical protein